MYKRTKQGWLKHLDFILLDVISAQLAFVLAYGIRHGFDKWVYARTSYRNLAIWMALFGVVVAVLFNTMHDVLKRRWTTEIRMTLTQCLLTFSIVIIFLFSVKDAEQFSRVTMWVMLLLYFPLALVTRLLWKRYMRYRLAREKHRVMLLVADGDSAEETVARIRDCSSEGINLCGVALTDRDAVGQAILGVPVVTNMDEAAQYICRKWIDEVYIAVKNSDRVPCDLVESAGRWA